MNYKNITVSFCALLFCSSFRIDAGQTPSRPEPENLVCMVELLQKKEMSADEKLSFCIARYAVDRTNRSISHCDDAGDVTIDDAEYDVVARSYRYYDKKGSRSDLFYDMPGNEEQFQEMISEINVKKLDPARRNGIVEWAVVCAKPADIIASIKKEAGNTQCTIVDLDAAGNQVSDDHEKDSDTSSDSSEGNTFFGSIPQFRHSSFERCDVKICYDNPKIFVRVCARLRVGIYATNDPIPVPAKIPLQIDNSDKNTDDDSFEDARENQD